MLCLNHIWRSTATNAVMLDLDDERDEDKTCFCKCGERAHASAQKRGLL